MSNKEQIPVEKRQRLAGASQCTTPAATGQIPVDWANLHHTRRLPESGFLRISGIVGKAATTTSPAIPAIIPVSKSTWWEGVRTGRYPQPSRALGARITVWSVESILSLIEQTSRGAAS